MTSHDEHNWWFPKKTFGWGWGLPSKWQGWTALATFLLLLCAGGPLASLFWGNTAATLMMVGLTLSFLIIVVLKGEPLSGKSVGPQQRNPEVRLRYYKISSCLISELAILLSLPLALKLIPRNGIYGFRVPSSLTGSSGHWFYVNEVAGLSGIAAGVLAIGFALWGADRLGMSDAAKGRAMLIVTIVLILAAMIPPFLVR